MPIHHYHNVPIQDNDVTSSYDRNDMFRKALIDVYLLRILNPKDYVHSQPQRHFYLKQYSCVSHSIFSFFTQFFILIGAMSESVLERLRQEVKEKEVERKVKAFRKEHIQKERAEQVRLTKTIYVEPFASCTPIAKEIQLFEQEKRKGNWKKN